ncbi:MAG: TlpA disulfide reductase family protein [Pseudomonadota bacterium]
MSRVFLVFSVALVALMAGALFYAARMPVQEADSAAGQSSIQDTTVTLDVVDYPEFSLPDLDGVDRHLSEWQGTNRILNFWATWCGPCKREIPVLKAFQDEHKFNGFQVIGIAVDFPEEVVHYAEAAEFNYPILIGEQDAMAIAESSGIEFVGLPFTMFVASDGEYLNAYLGELHQEHLDKIVDIMTRLDRSEISKDDAKAELGFL